MKWTEEETKVYNRRKMVEAMQAKDRRALEEEEAAKAHAKASESDGRVAYHCREPLAENPHNPGSAARFQWDRGWVKACMED